MVLATGFTLSWFAAAFVLSVTGWFERFSAGTLFTFGAVASAIGFATLHLASESFRELLRGTSLRWLTLGQMLRFYGSLAIWKAWQGELPPVFAIPTGVMDVALAASSFYVAFRLVTPNGRTLPGFASYHLLGVCSLGLSVGLALASSTGWYEARSGGVSGEAMSAFPMSLVPSFIGPFVFILHALALLPARNEQHLLIVR